MDPTAGRIWMDRRRLVDALYIHEQQVPRDAWEEWSQTDTFRAGPERRLRALGVDPALGSGSCPILPIRTLRPSN